MRKGYSPEFKAKVTLELVREEKSVAEFASEYGAHLVMLQRSKKDALLWPDMEPDLQERVANALLEMLALATT